MVKGIIKNIKIIDSRSKWNGQIVSIEIENGIIKQISKSDLPGHLLIDGKGKVATIGWMDIGVGCGDPGLEFKEDIYSVCKAASKGGYSEIVLLPTTSQPIIQSKESVQYIINKSKEELVKVYPMGALTLNNKGEELTEMIDMHHSGAIAFTDGIKPVWHSDVLLRGLLYLQPLNSTLFVHAEDKYLSYGGQMNEGKISTTLGFKGLPKLSEEIIVERDLSILAYTGGKLHFTNLSSPKSFELVKDAKKKGLEVTCSIAAYNLVLDETLLTGFDTNYKLNPPLRNKKDIDKFWKYIFDNTIDVITSAHIPQDIESKKLEYDMAEFGAIGLETTLGSLNKVYPLEQWIDKVTINPRKVLGVEMPSIEVASIANLTIIDTDTKYVYEEKNIVSKSKNSPFINTTLKGIVVATINQNKMNTY
jgi:dihydroorotase